MIYKSISTEYQHVAAEANKAADDGWRVLSIVPHYSKPGWMFILFVREVG